MRIKQAALAALLPAALAASCARGGPPVERPPLEPLAEVLRVEVSGVPDARSWVVHGQQEWRALWDSIPDRELGGRTHPVVDIAQDMVVDTAGNGRSGAPALTFQGYVAHSDTTDVFVRSENPRDGCGAADDITQVLIAGRIPRRGARLVRVIRNHTLGCGG